MHTLNCTCLTRMHNDTCTYFTSSTRTFTYVHTHSHTQTDI